MHPAPRMTLSPGTKVGTVRSPSRRLALAARLRSRVRVRANFGEVAPKPSRGRNRDRGNPRPVPRAGKAGRRRNGRGLSRAATPSSTATSRSRCCRRRSPPIRIGWRASSAKRRCWPRSTTRTSRAIYGLEEVGTAVSRAGPGAGRGPDAGRSHRARADRRWTRRCRSPGRSPRRSKPRTTQGIVHRDLKPANIKVRAGRHREGARLRAGQGARPVGAGVHAGSLANSPTLTARGDAGGHDPRHGRLHGARAGARAGRSTSAPTSGRSASCCTRC